MDRDEFIRVLRAFEASGLLKADMPVQKFRSIEDMNHAPVRRNRQPDVERFLRHCARYRIIAPKVYPRGVFRFRSIEDAERARNRH